MPNAPPPAAAPLRIRSLPELDLLATSDRWLQDVGLTREDLRTMGTPSIHASPRFSRGSRSKPPLAATGRGRLPRSDGGWLRRCAAIALSP
jgi:hypothetical protein